MIRTIWYHIILVGTFLYGMVFRYPALWFMGSEKRYKYSSRIAKTWGKNIVWASGSKVNVIYDDSLEDIEKIKSTGEAVILISNHQSNIDIPVLIGYFPMFFSFVAKKEMKKWPLIGRWMRSFDCIFLDRKNPRQGMKDMKEAIEKIKKGHSYVIFPEGSRSFNGEIQEFKKGSFKLATDTGAKIIPVTLIGTYSVQSRKSLRIKPNKNIKMVISKPVETINLSNDEKKVIDEKIRDIILKKYEYYSKIENKEM